MKIRQNLHIHSVHSCDSAAATLNDIQREMTECGMAEYGVSDHLHTAFNLCDIASCRNDFDAYPRPPQFHFGAEITCMAKWECDKIAAGDFKRVGDDPVYGLRYAELPQETPELAIGLTEEDVRRYGIEYVIGGVHWPTIGTDDPDSLYEDHFRQMLFLVRHPLVNILAHPWDEIEIALGGRHVYRPDWKPVPDAFMGIPERMNEQLRDELLKHGKCVEINLGLFQNPYHSEASRRRYWKILEDWRDAGVRFTFGTDLHAAHGCSGCLVLMEHLLDAHGFREEHFRMLF